jgi:hypothetical protein
MKTANGALPRTNVLPDANGKKAPIDAKIPFRRSPSGEHRLPRIKGMHGNGILTSLVDGSLHLIKFDFLYHIISGARLQVIVH